MALVALGVSSCQHHHLVILKNASGAPVRVTYAVPLLSIDGGVPDRCELPGDPPSVTSAPPSMDWWANTFQPPADLKIDAEKCVSTFTVPVGAVAILGSNGYCEDFESYPYRGNPLQPDIAYLIVEGASRVEWREWDAIRQFKRVKNGNCVYSFPA